METPYQRQKKHLLRSAKEGSARYNERMPDPAQTSIEERLEQLETRYAFQEETLRQLDEVVQKQADLIDALQLDLARMRTELAHDPESEAPPEEQVPPHY